MELAVAEFVNAERGQIDRYTVPFECVDLDLHQDVSEHAEAVQSDVVVLPEMPFHPWLFTTRRADPDRWDTQDEK